MFERLIADCDKRQQTLFAQFREIWMGMTMPEFRAGLKAMITNPPNNFEKGEGKTFPSNLASE